MLLRKPFIILAQGAIHNYFSACVLILNFERVTNVYFCNCLDLGTRYCSNLIPND